FLNLKVHDNGSSRFDHGFYLGTPSSLIDGCDVYNNSGYGIQVYSGSTDNTIVRNNEVHDNRGDGGVTLNHGDDIQFYNNAVYNNKNGVEVSYGNSTNTQIYNNVIHDNFVGITILESSIEATIQNNILYQNVYAIDDHG